MEKRTQFFDLLLQVLNSMDTSLPTHSSPGLLVDVLIFLNSVWAWMQMDFCWLLPQLTLTGPHVPKGLSF